MGEIDLAIYVAVTVIGIVLSSWLGFREAKQADPAVVFDASLFYQSVLRALPGIAVASFALAASGVTVQGIITALTSSVGSDVLMKRAGIKKNASANQSEPA